MLIKFLPTLKFGGNSMTKEQKDIVSRELILLNIDEVEEVTGWCKQVVRNTFAYDKDFPAIKKGKEYQVELSALREYLSTRRNNKDKN